MTKRTLFALLSGWCVACSSNAPTEPVPLKVLHQGDQCGKTDAGIEQITDTSDLRRYMRPPVPPGLGGNDQARDDRLEVAPDDKVFIISMGQQPSGGYAVSLSAEVAEATHSTLALPVTLEHPAPDSMQTQQVTTPCLIVAAGPGAYDTVKVLAQPEWQIPVR